MINSNNRTETRSANGIDYIYEFLEDGWIAIYRFIDGCPLIPVIQAKTVDKTDEFIAFKEAVGFPLQKLV